MRIAQWFCVPVGERENNTPKTPQKQCSHRVNNKFMIDHSSNLRT